MDEKNRAKDEQDERLEIPHILLTPRTHMHSGAAVCFRILDSQAGTDRLQFRTRLRDRDAFFELADRFEKKLAARMVFLSELKRQPDVGDFGKRQPFGITPMIVVCLPLIGTLRPTAV